MFSTVVAAGVTSMRRGSVRWAAATRAILDRHDLVSLYVNDFNVRAVRTYLRTGFVVVGEFATVLY